MMLSTRTHRAAAAAPAIRARQARVPRFSSSSSVAGRRGGVAMRAAADAGAGGDAEEGEEEWPQPASEEIKRCAVALGVKGVG